jgi:glycerol-3-phosphate cytidylyltransferase
MISGFVCSAFDLFHAGHVALLKECKQHCDYLICGLHTDPNYNRPHKNKPVQSIYERYIQLSGCRYVDQIIPYDTENDLLNILSIEKIDKRFLGTDYFNQSFTGKELCSRLNIEIIYIKRLHSYSSSELRKRIGYEQSDNI